MKHKWFYVGLVLSLTFNAGTLGLCGLVKYQTRRVRAQVAESSKTDASQLQIDRLEDDWRKVRAPAADSMRAAIKELGLLALELEPDSGRINAALDRIARAKREHSRLAREYVRACNRVNRPDLVEFMRNHTKVELDSALKANSSGISEPQEPR